MSTEEDDNILCEGPSLNHLPYELVVKILSFCRVSDYLTMAKTCKKMNKICQDNSLVRHLNLSLEYGSSEKDVTLLYQVYNSRLLTLNLEHCHWLQMSEVFFCTISTTLTNLWLGGCRVEYHDLDLCLSFFSNIRSLSWDDSSSLYKHPSEFLQAFTDSSKAVLGQLKELKLGLPGVNVAVTRNFIDDANFYSILQYCHQLQHLHIDEIPRFLTIRQPSELWNTRNVSLHFPELRTLTVANTSNKWFPPRGTLLGTLRAIPLDNNVRVLLLPNALIARGPSDVIPTARAWRDIVFPRLKCVQHLDVRGISHVHDMDVVGVDITAELNRNLPPSLLSYQWSGSGRKENTEMYKEMFYHLGRRFPQLQTLTIEDTGEDFPHNCPPPDILGVCHIAKYCHNIRKLNLSGTHYEASQQVKKRVATSISSMKGLKSLALPACLVGTGRSAIPKFNISETDDLDDNEDELPPLEVITEGCQLIEEFELIADYFGAGGLYKKSADLVIFAGKCDHLFATLDKDIAPIANWKYLGKLTLAGLLGVTDGAILVAIATNCKALSYLSLAYLGPYKQQCLYKEGLIEALSVCDTLKELRIEQPNLEVCDNLLMSIYRGPLSQSIQSVCIISRDARLTGDLGNLIGFCRKLVWCVILCHEDRERCYQLTFQLRQRFKHQRRRALYVVIHSRQLDQKYSQRTLAEMPRCYFERTLNFRSRVGEGTGQLL